MSLIERAIRERIVLVGVTIPPETVDDTEAHLDELALLVGTAGADVVARVVQRRDAPDPATYVGKGKAEELKGRTKQAAGDMANDERLRSEGEAQEAGGRVQKGFGTARRKVGNAVKNVGESIKRT